MRCFKKSESPQPHTLCTLIYGLLLDKCCTLYSLQYGSSIFLAYFSVFDFELLYFNNLGQNCFNQLTCISAIFQWPKTDLCFLMIKIFFPTYFDPLNHKRINNSKVPIIVCSESKTKERKVTTNVKFQLKCHF